MDKIEINKCAHNYTRSERPGSLDAQKNTCWIASKWINKFNSIGEQLAFSYIVEYYKVFDMIKAIYMWHHEKKLDIVFWSFLFSFSKRERAREKEVKNPQLH